MTALIVVAVVVGVLLAARRIVSSMRTPKGDTRRVPPVPVRRSDGAAEHDAWQARKELQR